MPAAPNPLDLPAGLPEPQDDGACAHLPGAAVPPLTLLGTDSATYRLDSLGSDRLVLYVYPATGRPGCDPGPEWDSIPGAPGCTVQSLGFRDHLKDFQQLGFAVVGLSAQTTEDQREFTARMAIPFVLLSDSTFRLADALLLPTFEAGGKRFYKRLVLVIERGIISHVFYPVFPPQQSALTVLNWLCQPEGRGAVPVK